MATIIALTGPSSSGKTTLARLLRDLFPHTFILHQDDFYRPQKTLPVREFEVEVADVTTQEKHTKTIQWEDWDCVESIDWPRLVSALQHIRLYAQVPPGFVSKEDQNMSAPTAKISTTLRDELFACVRDRCGRFLGPAHPLCILDGFLILPAVCPKNHQEAVRDVPLLPPELLDAIVFLPTSFSLAKKRREQRGGYVCAADEDYWVDPPGYFEQLVWANYVRDHKRFFEGDDCEGRFVGYEGMERKLAFWDGWRDADDAGNVGKCLKWAIGEITKALIRRTRCEQFK